MNKAPRSVLLVTPHQDDAEGGCGGSVGLWTKQGAKAVYVLCTNGDKGSSDPTMTSPALAAIREKEQLNAARVLGVESVVFLRHPDGGLEDTLELRAQVVREIRRHKPEAVMCIDPFRTTSHTHRDHRVSGMVALDAVFTYAWSPHQFPEQISEEGLEPHQVSEIYMWGSERPDTYVDISDTVDAKALSLSRHVSQMREPERLRERTRQRAQNIGQRVGLPFAEAFRHIERNTRTLHWAEF